MANSTITIITSITMIILFTIAIISFSIEFGRENDAFVTIDQNDNITSLHVVTRDGLDTFKGEVEETHTSIINSTIEPGSDVVKSPSIFSITGGNIFSVFSNIINVGYKVIFGEGEAFGIFLTTLVGLLLFVFTLYLIKAWRGNP